VQPKNETSKPMSRSVFVVLVGLALVANAGAVETRQLNPSETERFSKVSHELIAPCCWREPIAIHRSEAAFQVLDEVQLLVASGRSEEEIKAIYVARYGTRILADPPGIQGKWLYVIPTVLFCCSVVLMSIRLRSLVATSAVSAPRVSSELIARVRDETQCE
jgi:cytochrome c-type biogenesis protein CcmH/NrfF